MRWIAEVLVDGGVSVHVVTAMRGTTDACFTTDVLCAGVPRAGGHLAWSLCIAPLLGRRLRRAGIGMLFVMTGPGGVLLLRRPAVPVVSIVFHTYAQQIRCVPGQRWKRLFVAWERCTLRRSRAVLCCSEDTRRSLLREYGLPAQRIHVVPHAVRGTWAGTGMASRQRGLCVCVARLERRKGVHVLLAAWPEVRRRVPWAELRLVGDGVERSGIDARIRQAGPSVRRDARLSQEELEALLQRAEIAVCPAFVEGFGLAAAEAMCAGALCIASDTEGLRGLIDTGRTGVLVPPGDAEALGRAIAAMLLDPARRERIALAGQSELLQRCDPAVASDTLRQAVDTIVRDADANGT